MTKEEAYNQLKDLIEDRKSFLSGDNKADDLFLKDIESIKIALEIIEKINEIKEYINNTTTMIVSGKAMKLSEEISGRDILEIIERGNRE